MTDNPSKQFFEMQVPFSFTKRIFKAMLYETLGQQAVIDALNQLWIDLERQEALSSLSFCIKRLKKHAEFVPISEHLADFEQALLSVTKSNEEADKALTQELNALIQEIDDLTSEIKPIETELNQLSEKMHESLNKHLNNTDSPLNKTPHFKDDFFPELIKNIDEHIENSAEAFASLFSESLEDFFSSEKSKVKSAPPNELILNQSMDKMMKDLKGSLKNSVPIKQHNSSGIAQDQLIERVIGAKEDPHHQIIKAKFSKACQKAVCLNRLQSKVSKVVELEKHAKQQKVVESHFAFKLSQ